MGSSNDRREKAVTTLAGRVTLHRAAIVHPSTGVPLSSSLLFCLPPSSPPSPCICDGRLDEIRTTLSPASGIGRTGADEKENRKQGDWKRNEKRQTATQRGGGGCKNKHAHRDNSAIDSWTRRGRQSGAATQRLLPVRVSRIADVTIRSAPSASCCCHSCGVHAQSSLASVCTPLFHPLEYLGWRADGPARRRRKAASPSAVSVGVNRSASASSRHSARLSDAR